MDIAGAQNPPNPLDDTERAAENLVLAKEVINKQCMRTASIVTVFSFIGFCFSFFYKSPMECCGYTNSIQTY